MIQSARRCAQIALTLAVAACAGKAAPEVVNPARELRDLRASDSDLTDIAVVAAQSLPLASSAQPRFAGVFVEGRRMRPSSQSVALATGFQLVESSGRAVTPQCRRVSSTGQSTPIPCPPSASVVVPLTYTFVAVRATSDSAYVGTTKADGRGVEESCITLRRAGNRWSIVRTTPTSDAKQCGR